MIGDGWQPISTAPKNKTPVLAVFRTDIASRTGRQDLERWEGVLVVVRHAGLAPDGFDIGWGMAAPVGFGGFPDDWFAGWRPLPEPPDRGGSSESRR